MDKKPTVSILIPIHDSSKTAFFLARLFESLSQQTSVDYEIVVTKEGLVGHNLNEGLKRCKGDLIKVMCQDDWLAHPHSLKNIVENFRGNWLISGSHNNQNPQWTPDLYLGVNKLGGLSAMTLLNSDLPQFDEDLEWMVDIDFYMKLYKKFGVPTILPGLNVNIGCHEGQLTSTLTNEQKIMEHSLIKLRYEE